MLVGHEKGYALLGLLQIRTPAKGREFSWTWRCCAIGKKLEPTRYLVRRYFQELLLCPHHRSWVVRIRVSERHQSVQVMLVG
jgi:hypothetical protein